MEIMLEEQKKHTQDVRRYVQREIGLEKRIVPKTTSFFARLPIPRRLRATPEDGQEHRCDIAAYRIGSDCDAHLPQFWRSGWEQVGVEGKDAELGKISCSVVTKNCKEGQLHNVR